MEGTRLVLIRHGESRAQTDRIVAGHSGCSGLSDLGRRQAAALARRFAETGELGTVGAIYTSLMARAVETAEIVAGAVGGAVERDCDFCEHHPGESGDGLPWNEFDRQFPAPATWDPDHRRPADGESWNEMRGRVARGLDRVIDRHAGETILVVCHGGVVGHSMGRWLDLPHLSERPSGSWFLVANTAITEWRYGPHPLEPGHTGWQLLRFNDHAHLAGETIRW